jgi:glycosyltransferase involved in cell wall biosynthesis
LLLEMRPALGGHAGIPQSSRLLFRHLVASESFEVEGLIQTSATVLAPGLPPTSAASAGTTVPDEDLNRLGRVVLSLDRPVRARHLHATLLTLAMYARHAIGHRQRLSRLPAGYFRDYLWRRMFARTLAAKDLPIISRAAFRIARIPWAAMHAGALVTRRLGRSVYLRLDTSQFDFMVSETPYPATVSSNTKLIVRYHDAIPILMPHTISKGNWHQTFHYHALRHNVSSGAWFACVSQATRNDLLSIFPRAEARTVVIPNMVSDEYFKDSAPAARVHEIIDAHRNERLMRAPGRLMHRRPAARARPQEDPNFLLMVSTLEPRKNHLNVLAAWARLRAEQATPPKLVIVGELGWHHEPIIARLRPWLARGEAFLLSNLLPSELRVLYRHARATLCPSFGEGFDYSGVEAMRCGSLVVASDIPAHREVYGSAALYFDPYDVLGLADAMRKVLEPAPDSWRAAMESEGYRVSAQYEPRVIVPQWESLFEQLRAKNP